MKEYDYLIIGGGIYGLYLSKYLSKDKKVLLIEIDNDLFTRSTYVNQARLHNGYHYPRSKETAELSANYYNKFINDFKDSINDSFDHIYSISTEGSKIDSEQFEYFCDDISIPYTKVDSGIFKPGSITDEYLVKECSMDVSIIKQKLLKDNNTNFSYNTYITQVEEKSDIYKIKLNNGDTISCRGVFNTTYSSINQIKKLFNFEEFSTKYQLCEMVICDPPIDLGNYGLTVMDGLFFSLMPFGLQNTYSLSSVEYTPHYSVYDKYPNMPCQIKSDKCDILQLDNCNNCPFVPKSNYDKMLGVVNNFIDVDINYLKSIYTIKVLDSNSEIDDSRLVSIDINQNKNDTFFISIFSGKLSSIYELDPLIKEYS